MIQPILKTAFGSHIYGTNLPTSDHDYKVIFLPEPKNIILNNPPFSIDATGGAPTPFSITIDNCLNNAAGTCQFNAVGVPLTGVGTDPANNPEVAKSGTIIPPQQGMHTT